MRKNSKQFAGGSRRGQKTLGWFLSEEVLEKTGSPSPPIQPPRTAVAPPSEKDDKHKRRRGGRGRSRKLTESLSTASEASLPMEGEEEKKTESESSATDFYVYDVASDGYYYEQNGAKGWRRRLPAGAQAKPRPPSAEEQAQQVVAAALARQAQMAGLPVFNSTAYNRYYDAGSDGYFFEMASVDGWRKRTPATSAATPNNSATAASVAAAAHLNPLFRPVQGGGSAAQQLHHQQQQQRFSCTAPAFMPSAPPSQSYGATLARGELPAKCVMESSASSSTSDDLGSFPSSLSRPTSLDIAGPTAHNEADEEFAPASGPSRLFAWDTDKFIEELVGQFSSSHLEAFDTTTPKTPSTSLWARRFSGPEEHSHHHATASSEDDQEEYALTKELENIWKTPTPVQQ